MNISDDDNTGISAPPQTKPLSGGWLSAAKSTNTTPSTILKPAQVSTTTTTTTSSSTTDRFEAYRPPAQPDSKWFSDPWDAFKQGVAVSLMIWDGLQLAIEQNFINNALELSDVLEEDIIGLFEKYKFKLSSNDLTDYLMDVSACDFKTKFEDGSCEWLARMLHQLYIDCMEYNNFDGLEKIFTAAYERPDIKHEHIGNDSDFDDDDDEDEEEEDYEDEDEDEGEQQVDEIDQLINELDLATPIEDDGWSTVAPSSNKAPYKYKKRK